MTKVITEIQNFNAKW